MMDIIICLPSLMYFPNMLCKQVNEQVYTQLKSIDERQNANILNFINVLERDDICENCQLS